MSATASSLRPGEYLHKRRTVAGLSVAEAARDLAMVPSAVPINGLLDKLEDRLRRAESDEEPLSLHQAALLRNVYPFDVDVYDRLLDRHMADEVTRRSLPEPQLCRSCACSFFDPCEVTTTADGGTFVAVCGWAEADLCSTCADRPKVTSSEPAAIPVIPILNPQGAC